MRLFILILIILLTSCQNSEQTTKKIDMYNSSGDMVGTATLMEQPDGVQIKVKVEGLTPGFHGIHIHEYSKCEGPDFISAGNHFNPEGKEHGLMHPKGAHLGDMPNVEADTHGIVEAELIVADATLLDGKKSILNSEGTSLLIKEDKDDGISQPGGDSGIRIICGEIKSKQKTDENESPTDPTDFNKKMEEE